MAGARRRRPRAAAPSRGWAVAMLVGAGAAAGLVYNVLAPRGIFYPTPAATDFAPAQSTLPRPPAPRALKSGGAVGATVTEKAVTPTEAPAAVTVIDLAEAVRLARAHAAAFVDARSPDVYALGRIPRALNIPSTDFAAGFGKVRHLLDPAAATVVYCTSEECDESDLVVEALRKAGFTSLLHYKQGWNAWENAGLPQEK